MTQGLSPLLCEATSSLLNVFAMAMGGGDLRNERKKKGVQQIFILRPSNNHLGERRDFQVRGSWGIYEFSDEVWGKKQIPPSSGDIPSQDMTMHQKGPRTVIVPVHMPPHRVDLGILRCSSRCFIGCRSFRSSPLTDSLLARAAS